MKKILTAFLLAVVIALGSCEPTGNTPGDASGAGAATTALEGADNETGSPSGLSGGENTIKETEGTKLNGKTPETLKILAIGNSFSTDGMRYLYDIAKSAGVKEITLGNLYIGGCSLATHLSHTKAGDAAYTYYKNTAGIWVTYKDKTFLDGLTDEKWDFISMQQSSPESGITSTYGSTLAQLVGYVKANKTNPGAKLIWHMTWAYQSDSTHSAFPRYNGNQTTMYNAIISAVEGCIIPTSDFSIIIPTGTAIQNARTSFAGDRLTRDGYHLNYNLGRYIAGLTWYAAISGAPIDGVGYNPAPSELTAEVMAMAKASVKDAVMKPYEVTESAHKTGAWIMSAVRNSDPVVPADCFEADLSLARSVGADLYKYVLLNYDYRENSYWYCTNGTKMTTPSGTAGTYKQNICSSRIYSKTEVPENSIIVCDAGWQFRPELWESQVAAAASRPAISTANVTLMDAAFWGSANYFAFNISANPKADISAYYASAASHFRIYVPVS